MKARSKTVALALLLWAPLGCATLLGIEDSSLDDAAAGGSGGTSGTGGTSGSGGTSGNGGTAGNGGSGGTTAGGSAGDGSGGEGGDGGQPALCETYCDTVMANCTDEFAVYTSIDVCLDLCATIPKGTPGDKEGDSVACRLNQATAAGTTQEPADHCPNAGLGGNEVCGTNCDAVCRAMLQVCPGEWPSTTACLDDCESLTDLGGFNTSQTEGTTVQCRIWHVGAATQATPPHCAHAAGAGPCSLPIE